MHSNRSRNNHFNLGGRMNIRKLAISIIDARNGTEANEDGRTVELPKTSKIPVKPTIPVPSNSEYEVIRDPPPIPVPVPKQSDYMVPAITGRVEMEKPNLVPINLEKPVSTAAPKEKKEAYVYLLTNDTPYKEIFALEASFKHVNSTRKRIAMVTPAVSAGLRDNLKALQIEVHSIEQPRHPKFRTQIQRWADTLAKFAIFDLDLTKFVYIDADFIISQNLDYLFDLDTNGKVYAMLDGEECFPHPTNMNAGLLVAQPNSTLKQELFNMLEDSKFHFEKRKGDQEMLDVYLRKKCVFQILTGTVAVIYFQLLKEPFNSTINTFWGMLGLLPEQDFAFIWRCECLTQKAIPSYEYSKVKAVHFTGWWLDPDRLLRSGLKSGRSWPNECGKMYYDLWLKMYEEGTQFWNAQVNNLQPYTSRVAETKATQQS